MTLRTPLPRCDSDTVDPSELKNLRAWAAARDQPVTVLDLEATTFIPTAKWFGITEVALLHVNPDGTATTHAALVDPERRIPKKVIEITGITNEAVEGQPTWAAWAPYLDEVATSHLTAGYCSFGFDCRGIVGQNARYDTTGTHFAAHLDVFALPGVEGRLVDAAAKYGVVSDTYHRALADTWVTARLLNALAKIHGFEVLDAHVGKQPSWAGGSGAYSPRDVRDAELLEHFAKHDALPDLEEFGARYGIKASTAENDVLRLIEAGSLAPAVLEVPALREWLGAHLEETIAKCWHGDAEGRLKPLMEELAPSAPEALDYTQLRLALMRRK